MRWLGLVVICAILVTSSAEPEPKKYKAEPKELKQTNNTSLTEEEKKFLREVETKFGIKSDVPVEINESEGDIKSDENKEAKKVKPLPAVIAIEIVNDTDSNSKGKRTIDANLGYGYRTNNGYSYSYFGKPSQDKGRFMIYPYSQEDIPPSRFSKTRHSSSGKYGSSSVEIQPSQAYELVQVKDEQSSYEYKKPLTEFKTGYASIKGLESPPPPYPGSSNSHSSQSSPSTLFTTYNGEQFSGLQGKFPSIMSNYLVDPSQLLQNPQYQGAGLTQDHLRSHGAHLDQRVVPVLVLRIPSSYLKNPSAELYANLPQNYPLSQHLNNVNLQELVNQYFKKLGYSYAPRVMTHPSPAQAEASIPAPVSNYEPQQYATPYVQPSYTQADYSGIQYSAVQPVMAKYPPQGYSKQQYYVSQSQTMFQPTQQQQYEYQYQYVPQPASLDNQQHYYTQPQYETQYVTQEEQAQPQVYETESNVEYQSPQGHSQEAPQSAEVEYETPKPQSAQQYATPQTEAAYEYPKTPSAEYGTQKEEYTSAQTVSSYGAPQGTVASTYSSSQPAAHYSKQPAYQYYKQERPVEKETITIYPSQGSQSYQKYSIKTDSGETQTYLYQKQGDTESASKSLVISENYPSKDHTQAYTLPAGYKTPTKQSEVQAVNYVTPMPYSLSKYQSHYRVMVPQTILKGSDKVSYANSHSLASQYLQATASSDYNPEEEYTLSSQYAPPIGSQKAPSYPKNYHPKRMVTKNESKTVTPKTSRKPQPERSEQKKSA